MSADLDGGPFQAEDGMVPGLGGKEGIPEQSVQVNLQHLSQFLPLLLHFDKDRPSHCFLGPGLAVENGSSLLLRILNHIRDDTEVSELQTEPFLGEVLGVGTKAENEIPLSLQLVDELKGFVDLDINGSNLLPIGGKGQKIAHLGRK